MILTCERVVLFFGGSVQKLLTAEVAKKSRGGREEEPGLILGLLPEL